MSLNTDEWKVDTVRILQFDKSNATTYRDNVTIRITLDSPRQLRYLRIRNKDQNVFMQEFNELQWIDESSMNGVTVIRSFRATVVIIYDAKNQPLVDFFAKLEKSLTHEATTESVNTISSRSNEAQLESMIDHLVKSINSDDSNEAEYITEELTKSRANVQFHLISKNANQAKNTAQSKLSNDVVESSASVLQLLLRVECSLNKVPIVAPIDVRSGTTLRSLKEQIEKETGVKCADQYWFAFERYLISDEYVFGSFVPFTSNQNPQTSSSKPIRSGDMLIMYIVQTSPYH